MIDFWKRLRYSPSIVCVHVWFEYIKELNILVHWNLWKEYIFPKNPSRIQCSALLFKTYTPVDCHLQYTWTFLDKHHGLNHYTFCLWSCYVNISGTNAYFSRYEKTQWRLCRNFNNWSPDQRWKTRKAV